MKPLLLGALFASIVTAQQASAFVRGSMTVFKPLALSASVPTAPTYDVHIVTSNVMVVPGHYQLLIDNMANGVVGLTVVDRVGNYSKVSTALAHEFDVAVSTSQVAVNEPPQVRAVVCSKHFSSSTRSWKTETVARVGTKVVTQTRLMRPGTREVLAVINQENENGVRDQIISQTPCVKYDARPEVVEKKSFDLMGLLMKAQSR